LILIATVAVASAAAAQDAQRRRARDGDRASQPRPAERAPERAGRPDRAVPRTVPSTREQQQNARRDDQARRDEHARRDGRYDTRRYDSGRYDTRRYDVGRYGGRYDHRRYTPRIVRPTIVRVVPYRPYVYRPSYSIGVYYGSGGHYPYGHTPRGYYNPIPGRFYGGVRITGAPRDARVFADGYYVGIVNDFDGIFQHLNLEAGPHHIEIDLGYDAIEFDVYVRPGDTTTFRADRY
jgi:hypothetical protein